MAISLLHAFQSAIPDGGDSSLVQPSNWNSEHSITMGTGKVLGRATAGTGAVEELSITGSGAVVAMQTAPSFLTSITTPIVTITQGTITDVAPQINGTVTWNDAADTFTAWKLNVTDTNSAAASLLMDLQVGGTTKFNVTKGGKVTIPDGNTVGLAYSGGSILYATTSTITAYNGVLNAFSVASDGVRLASTLGLAWTSTADSTGTRDLILLRDAANTLAQRNSTNAQIFRVYNTYTDASNGEWYSMAWASNVAKLLIDKNGTGTYRNFALNLSGFDAITCDSSQATFNVSISGAGSIRSTGNTAGVGYNTGAGGTVTQATSRTTGVTLDRPTGAITLVSAAGSTTPASFTLTNARIAATDVIIVEQKSGTDLYEIFVTAIAAGSCQITFFTTGGTTTEQPVFNFAIIKGATS